ncbi:MAG: glycosyl transferase family 2, partial [Verrucomicrobia bacterium]|nr:glycosyl transferase family 2 [Deltaproteobacteria bacterium]
VARLYAYGLTRREAPFAAVVLHLWHPENSRGSLAGNDRLLEQSLISGQYRCPHGIVKDGETAL